MSKHTLMADPTELTEDDLMLLGSFMHYVAKELTELLKIAETHNEQDTLIYKNLESFIEHITDNLHETTETTH